MDVCVRCGVVALRILSVHNTLPNYTVEYDDKDERYNVANEDVYYNVVNLFEDLVVPGFMTIWK